MANEKKQNQAARREDRTSDCRLAGVDPADPTEAEC
jgi:hypothetical protein